MKRSFLLGLAGMAGLMMVPLSGKEPEIRLEKEVAGIRYGVYEDRECQIPLLDEQGERIELISDEHGILSSPVPIASPSYLQQTGTVTGYYYDAQIYPLRQDTFILPVCPIEVNVDCSEWNEGTFQILDEDREVIIMEWSLEDCENPSVEDVGSCLDAEKSYVLVQKGLPEWMYGKELPFTIPAGPVETIRLVPERISYGKAIVNMEGIVEGYESIWQLFADEECMEPAEDVYGEQVKIETDGTYTFDLPEGSYRWKNVRDDLHYLKENIQQLTVTSGKIDEIKIGNTLIQPVVTLLDGQMNPLDGSFDVMDEEGETVSVSSKQSVVLKRDHTYRIIPRTVPDGYYIPDAVEVKTVYDNGTVHDIDVTASCFSIFLHLIDQQTENGISGAEFAVYDDQNSLLSVVRSEKGGAQLCDVKAGKSYRIHQIRTTGTWLPVEDQILSVPLFGEKEIHLTMEAEGYVHLSASIMDSFLQPVPKGSLSVFMDVDCTVPAYDIHGMPITGSAFVKADVRNGSYYVRMDDVGQQWYLNQQPVLIAVDHAMSELASGNVVTQRADYSFSIKDDLGNDIGDDFVVELYENGRKTGTVKADGTSVVRQGFDLNRDSVYQVRTVCMQGQYVFSSDKRNLTIAKEVPQESQGEIITAVPYVTLRVMEDQAGLSGSYRIYSDRECTILAESISDADDQMHHVWNLRDGTYWITTESLNDSWYPRAQEVSIKLDHSRSWNETVLMSHTPVTMILSSMDEKGQSLDGTMVEIRAMDGTVQQTAVFTDGLLVLQGSWLKKGCSYVVAEIQTPDGYHRCADIQFTVPLHQPSTTPSISIVHQKQQRIVLPQKENTTSSFMPEEQKEAESAEQKRELSSPVFMGMAVSAGILISAVIILKNISKGKV